MKKIYLLFGVVLFSILLLIVLFYPDENNIEYSQEVMECITNNSILYTQLGCSHCEKQEGILGDNIEIFKVVDCFYDLSLCSEGSIMYTPTWIIGGIHIKGVYSIEELKSMTGC